MPQSGIHSLELFEVQFSVYGSNTWNALMNDSK